MTLKSHVSVVFVNLRRAVTERFPWSLDHLPFEGRGKLLKGSGGLVLRVQYPRHGGSSLGLREQKMHFIVKGLFQFRYVGACNRYHL